MNDELTAETLARLLKNHDWWYEYADSGMNRRRGEASWKRIVDLCSQLPADVVVEMWLKHAPREFDDLLQRVLPKS